MAELFVGTYFHPYILSHVSVTEALKVDLHVLVCINSALKDGLSQARDLYNFDSECDVTKSTIEDIRFSRLNTLRAGTKAVYDEI